MNNMFALRGELTRDLLNIRLFFHRTTAVAPQYIVTDVIPYENLALSSAIFKMLQGSML
jgi:hypothetical protein